MWAVNTGSGDVEFTTQVSKDLAGQVSRVLGQQAVTSDGLPLHRDLMRRARCLIVAHCWRRGGFCAELPDGDGLLEAAMGFLDSLASLQGPDGLFSNDNPSSPPDTAFAIQDLCDTYQVAARDGAPELAPVQEALARIAARAKLSLLAGGVHTPNHRWELAAALARMHECWPDEALVTRANEWLAEGIDIDDDGLYSERSAIYAAHVTNPSLVALAGALQRPDLLDIVAKNLGAIVRLAAPDDTVETMFSRRQDQRSTFRLAPFAMLLRRVALLNQDGHLAWWAQRAAAAGLDDPCDAAAQVLREPWLAQQLPPGVPPERRATYHFNDARLTIRAHDRDRLVVWGGNDYATQRQVRSGLACNPTFLRYFHGHALLDAVRLSRDFFGLGPFRAQSYTADERQLVLSETISAAYYQPLPASRRRSDGRYEMAFDGRFFASMQFGERPADYLGISTELTVTPLDEGFDLAARFTGKSAAACFEFTFAQGGVLDGDLVALDDSRWCVNGQSCRYRVGKDSIEVAFDRHIEGRAFYHPGEEYTALGGTNATKGIRVYFPLLTAGQLTVHVRGR